MHHPQGDTIYDTNSTPLQPLSMIVIDTTVFIGACKGNGASARIIELCLTGHLQPVIGSALMLEYEDVLSRAPLFEGSRLDSLEREELFDIFLARCRWVKTYFSWRPNVRDEGDNHVVELAIAAAASHIVTWNTRDFAAMELRFPLLRLTTPPQFLKEMTP